MSTNPAEQNPVGTPAGSETDPGARSQEGASASEQPQVEITAPLDSPGGSGSQAQGAEDSGSPQDDQEHSGDPKNKEAAKYRRQLRETEAERDGLKNQVDQLRTDLLAEKLPPRIKAKAVLSVVSMDDLLTEGSLDDAKVAEAVKKAQIELGIGVGVPSSSALSKIGSTGVKGQHTWDEALRR